MAESGFPPRTMRAGNRLLAVLHRAGIHPGPMPMYLLTVPLPARWMGRTVAALL
jgi:hypothetical protein